MTEQTKRYRRAFWAAVILTVAAWLLPFGGMAIYPFSLLATWAHEMGHGLAALLVGGSFHQLEIFPRLSGMATTTTGGGLPQAIMAAGGLVGAPLLGAGIIALGPRPAWARGILFGLAGVLALSVAIWVRNPFGIVALIVLAVGVGAGAWKLKPSYRFIAVQLLGIQLSLSALRGWRYLFMAEAKVGGRIIPSDVSAISNALGGPHWMWGVLILTFNLAVLYGAYRLVMRRLRRDPALATDK
jgi:hypothetical protein